MSKPIFVVMGDTGEYSDNRKWLVHAFLTEESANKLVDKLDAAFSTIKKELEDSYVTQAMRTLMEEAGDPLFDCAYSRVDYYVVEIPLTEA